MVDITLKDKIYGTAILILITIMGVQLDSTDDWYYCEVENSLKECSELKPYGIPNAKCVGVDGVNDICTASGVRKAWQPLENYVNLTVEKEVVVESLQFCELEYFNVSEPVYSECIKINYTDNCIIYYENGSCNYFQAIQYNSTCFDHSEIIEKNRTVCNPIGFNVVYKNGDEYNITGSCCGYFNESKQIVCKEEIAGICNPVCQQTSINPDEYDEYCMIYNIGDKEVFPELVGSYDYVRNNQVKLSDMKVKLK